MRVTQFFQICNRSISHVSSALSVLYTSHQLDVSVFNCGIPLGPKYMSDHSHRDVKFERYQATALLEHISYLSHHYVWWSISSCNVHVTYDNTQRTKSQMIRWIQFDIPLLKHLGYWGIIIFTDFYSGATLPPSSLHVDLLLSLELIMVLSPVQRALRHALPESTLAWC